MAGGAHLGLPDVLALGWTIASCGCPHDPGFAVFDLERTELLALAGILDRIDDEAADQALRGAQLVLADLMPERTGHDVLGIKIHSIV